MSIYWRCWKIEKTSMTGSGTRFPVAVLTGFLGSGKTTLLRRLLTDRGMSKTAVLINEFGEIGLDHLVVRSVAEGAVVLQNGCICCTLRTDLQQGLRDLIDSRGGGTLPDFDRVVIETTGLADPAPIAQTLLIDPMLRHQVRLANIITTIDGMHSAAQLSQHTEALRQAAIADRLVITKTDLISRGQFDALARQLLRLNPTARIFDVHSHDFNASSLLFEGVGDPATKLTEVRHWLDAALVADHDHHHDGSEGAHAHLAGIHSSNIRSFSLRIEEEIDWAAFGVWLTVLLHRHGGEVLRVKGLLNVSDALGPVVLNGVQHVIHPPVHLEEWPDDDRASRLVFVVQGIDPAVLGRSLATFLRAARGPVQARSGEMVDQHI
jgi:G3E family GTPase